MATPSAASQPGHGLHGHNPLHRHCDSVRMWLAVLFAVGLGLMALLAAAFGVILYSHYRAAEARQERALHQVTAVAAAASPPAPAGGSTWVAMLAWTDATGRHVARGQVPAATVPGSDVAVWVDSTDVPHAPPKPAVQTAGTALAYAVLAFAGPATILAGAHAWAQQRLNDRAAQSWEEEWALVEPQWSRWNRQD